MTQSIARTEAACLSSAVAEMRERDQTRRLAIIEHNRTMREQRAFAEANRARIDAEWDALPCPPRTIEAHLRALQEGGKQ